MTIKRLFRLTPLSLAILTLIVFLLSVRTDAGSVTSARPNGLVASPYLGETTPTSVVVAWATDTAGASEVRYSQDQSYDQTVAAASFIRDGKYWHSATITGLTPGTAYHYRVYTGGVDLTPWPDITFSTAPPDITIRVTFAGLGDSRPGSAGSSPSQAAWDVAAQLAQRSFDFALHTGDIVHSGGICTGDDSAWNQYLRAYFAVFEDSAGDTPFYTAMGNHELNNGSCGYQAYTDVYHLPENAPPGDEEKYYSFDWGNVHVIALNTEQSYATGSAQYNWLENDLQNTSQPWIVAIFHRPAYSSGNHGSTADVQTYLVPLFETYGVDAVLNGHDHIYERTCPIKEDACTTIDGGGVVYFVTGGAGASSYTPGTDWFTVVANSKHHFMMLSVDDCKLNIQAIDDNGVVFDTYQIDKCLGFAPQTGAGIANDTSFRLSWNHVTQDKDGNAVDVQRYDVYRATVPYPDVVELAGTVNGPFSANPVTWTDPDHLGDAATNYFYYVRAVTISGGQETPSELSNHTGEFDYDLIKGQ